MKIYRIKYLIPLFLFIGFFCCCSLSVQAAVPTAPDSVTVKVKKDGTDITRAAKGSRITISAQASGGSGSSSPYYEYSFLYKTPNSNSFEVLQNYNKSNYVNHTLYETGTYTFRVNARVTDGTGISGPHITKDININSIGISNTSTISSSAINLGESVTINASASGGSQYEYYYSVSIDDGSHYAPIQPSSNSAQYVASASCTYKPTTNGNYLIRVSARDKSTGSTDQKIFTVTASSAALINQCDVSNTEVEITGKGQSVSLIFKAEKGKTPYKYRCSYVIEGSDSSPEYIVGNASTFVSVSANKQFTFQKIGKHLFTFEVQDADGKISSKILKSVNVTTNMNNTSTTSSSSVNNLSGINFFCSATGGTGDYEYMITYRIGTGGTEKTFVEYAPNTTESLQIPELIRREHLEDGFTGKVIFKIYARDKETMVTIGKEFAVNVTEALAGAVSRQQLLDLYVRVREWEGTLKQSQRDNLNSFKTQYISSRDMAYSATVDKLVQDYGKYYFDLYNKWIDVKNDPLGDEFWMTKEVNNVINFETSIIKSVEGWFKSFSGVNVSTGTFTFNMENFVEQFSQIFVVFASSLLVILFGVNIIKTAVEYELFTMRGAVKIFARLLLAELWIQLSTKMCVLIIKIFNELMAKLITAVDTSGLLKTTNLKFESTRSGVYLVGDIIDFFANLCPFLLVVLLAGVVVIVFLIVYIKLVIRSFEIAMLSVISPVFFACSVGEATMPYFRKFITSFVAVTAEIVFMALVYMAFLWYCKETVMSGAIELNKLYNLSSDEAGRFYTYIAVSVACGIMMIRPPQVLKDLVRT